MANSNLNSHLSPTYYTHKYPVRLRLFAHLSVKSFLLLHMPSQEEISYRVKKWLEMSLVKSTLTMWKGLAVKIVEFVLSPALHKVSQWNLTFD